MSWGSAVERREEFVRLAGQDGTCFSELCRRFGVSRSNGYKWLSRHGAEGRAGLEERSRRPHRSPAQTAASVEAAVLAVRAAHPAWGGRKIQAVLRREGLVAPAASTITAILRRAGVLEGPGAGAPRSWIRFEREAPNDLWQMNFKGHFGLTAGRCHPLTVLDDHSRYALDIGACGDERTATVRERLTATFRRYGLPARLLADNGPPRGTAGSDQQHTPLTIWLLDLGVSVSHGRPYHPQTQGKDERFHRTLKAEVLDGRHYANLPEAQRAFDAWREVYNIHRPHEAIDMAVPAERYRSSARSFPDRVEPPAYEPQAHVRKVHDAGWINFKGPTFNCPKALTGRKVALRATETDGVFDLCYRSHLISQIDLRQNIRQPVLDVSEQVSPMSPV